MQTLYRFLLVALLGLVALLAVAPVSSTVAAEEQSLVAAAVHAQQPTPPPGPQITTPNSEDGLPLDKEGRRRITFGVLAFVLLIVIYAGHRIRKKRRQASAG